MKGPRARISHWVMAGMVCLLVGVFLIWPIVSVVGAGFVGPKGFTLKYVGLIFEDEVLVRGLINAGLIAVAVTGVTLVVSLPLAIWSVRYEFLGRRVLGGMLMLPLVVPPFVGAIGMRLMLSRFGPLTQLVGGGEMGIDWLGRLRIFGVIGVEAIGLLPIMLLNLQAGLGNIDPAMELAARNLGASRWRTFWKVTFPLMRSGVFAGCTLVAIWSFTELGTPLMFEFYTVTPVQVFERITDVAGSPIPFALVVVMLGASAVLYLIGRVLLGGGVAAGVTKGGMRAEVKRLRGWKAAGVIGCFLVVVGFAVLPHVAVILTSVCQTGAWYRSVLPRGWTGMHYVDGLRYELAFPSIRHSLMYSSLAVVGAMTVGLMAAVVIVRSRVPGRKWLDVLTMLPLAVPGVVLAFGYLAMSAWVTRRWGGGTPMIFNIQEWPVGALVAAYAIRRLPYVVRAAVAGLEQTPVDLELAAANLGARRWRVLQRITLPLIAANLIAGGLLAFTYSMLEVGDSLILAQRMDYYPITKAIWELAQRLGDGIYIASALGVWAMVLLGLTLVTAGSLLGKRGRSAFGAN